MPRLLTRLLQSLAPIFRPPFEGLILLVVLYYGWCFFVYPHSQTLRGNLPDPDDYMYLSQVLDWLKGQDWYDNVQHRLNPPEGVPIHFSRLAQLPMAAFILLFEKASLPPHGAALLMAIFYPLVLLAGLLLALRWLMKSFVPLKWISLSAYVALFATGMMFMFTPGHVDHHGLVIILVILTLGFVMRMIEEPSDPRWGVYAGLVLALALTVALETLPWLLVIALFLGLWAMAKGGKAAINALGFGLALYLGSAGFLALTRAPVEWFTTDILTYSAVYVLLTGAMAVSFAGVAVLAKSPTLARWIFGSGIAAFLGLLFLHHFPDMLVGPYGGMDPELARIMLSEIDEATPLITSDASLLDLFLHVANAMLAGLAGVIFFRQAKGEARWRWGLLLALLVSSFGLTVFYEQRFTGMMGMLTIIPLTVMLQRGWLRIGKEMKGRRKVFAEVGLLLLVGPLASVLFPALVDGRSFNTGILLFPVDGSFTKTPCDTYVLEKILNDPALYGDRPHRILGVIGQGPELLFRTQHQVFSAPFHMDVTGNIDATRFFSTPYATEARAIARRRQADLVVACRLVPDLYTRPPNAAPGSATRGTGKDFAPHLIELLMTDKAPSWLKKMNFAGLHNFVIYEIAPEADEAKKPQSPR